MGRTHYGMEKDAMKLTTNNILHAVTNNRQKYDKKLNYFFFYFLNILKYFNYSSSPVEPHWNYRLGASMEF